MKMIEYGPDRFISSKSIDRAIRSKEEYVEIYQRDNAKVVSVIWEPISQLEPVQEYMREFFPECCI